MASESFYRLLNIRREERSVVTKLFWFQFFQGAGIAFLFTGAITGFLKIHKGEDLANVYVLSSLALLVTGYIYSRLEHKYSVTDFSRRATLFMGISIAVVYIAGLFFPIPGYDYILFVWYHIMYLVTNLEFWSIASMIFDVRQSKRLFSIISAGEIPGKLIGYTMVAGVAKSIGGEHMLIPASIFMLLSLPVLKQLSASSVFNVHTHDQTHTVIHEAGKDFLKTFIKKITGHNLIIWVALLTFVMSTCLIAVNFSFYSKIKDQFAHDDELAYFVGAFMAIVQITTLLVKLLFTSRVIAALGIKKSLLLTPAILGLLIATVIALQHFTYGDITTNTAMIIMFGITCIIIDVLKIAVNTPVFLTIMQPLGLHDRLRAHNIVKGVMDPFAYLFTGTLILVLSYRNHEIDLMMLYYILLGFTLLWIVQIFFVNRAYIKTVMKAISGRFYTRTDFTIEDADTRLYISHRLESGKEEEILHILQLLHLQDQGILQKTVAEKLLQSGSALIQEEVLKLTKAGKTSIDTPALTAFTDDQQHPVALRKLAFSCICDRPDNERYVYSYINTADPVFKQEAFSALLKKVQSPFFGMAVEAVRKLLASTDPGQRLLAVESITQSGADHFRSEILALINDGDRQVQAAALIAAGASGDENCIRQLVQHTQDNRKAATAALLLTGEKAIPFIDACIQEKQVTDTTRKHLIGVAARIGGASAVTMMVKLPHHLPKHLHALVKGLYTCTEDAKAAGVYEQTGALALNLVNQGGLVMLMLGTLEKNNEQTSALVSALRAELLEIRESLILLFSVMYGKEEIKKIRRGFALNTKESIANALELAELMIPKKYAHDFTILYEPAETEHKVTHMQCIKGKSYSGLIPLIENILLEKEHAWHDFTRSCALYLARKKRLTLQQQYIQPYLQAEHPMVRETAAYATSTVMDNTILLLEKVLILKNTALFAGTPENILADLAPLMQQVVCNEGTVIFEEGAYGDSMYIIYQGSVRIHKGATTLAILSHENEVFGELSLFDAERRSATATAHTDCILFKIEQQPFYELIEIRPEIIAGAAKMLCKRLRVQNEVVAKLTHH